MEYHILIFFFASIDLKIFLCFVLGKVYFSWFPWPKEGWVFGDAIGWYMSCGLVARCFISLCYSIVGYWVGDDFFPCHSFKLWSLGFICAYNFHNKGIQ